MTGKIKFFDTEKGYGFITSGEFEGDLFVHHADVLQNGPKRFEPGDKVDFEVSVGPNGKNRAVRVSKIQ